MNLKIMTHLRRLDVDLDPLLYLPLVCSEHNDINTSENICVLAWLLI